MTTELLQSQNLVHYYYIINVNLKLTELNLGNNVLEEIPSVLKHLCCLKKLYLYGNNISHLSSEVLGKLKLLRFIL